MGAADNSAGLDYSVRFDGGKNDEADKVFLRSEWEKRVAAALAPYDCPATSDLEYPRGYYTGPLIDTHLHMPQLSDDFGGPDDREGEGRGVDADQYDEIAGEDRPLLGETVTVDQIACTLKQERTTWAFTFFPVFPESPAPLIDVAHKTRQRHGSLFVPFIQSTGSEISTVKAETLQKMLSLRPGLFAGFGEVGDSPTEPINPPPDTPIYLEDFRVAGANNLLVYFHPGVGHQQNLERALQEFPEVTFIVHGDFVRPYIGDLMAGNPNIFFTANDIFEEAIPLFRFGDKQRFIAVIERDWDALLAQAVTQYEPLIDEYPDRFMWGTDRVDIVWNYDADVGLLLARFGRAFIGRLDPTVQERFAYQNAERLLQRPQPPRPQ